MSTTGIRGHGRLDFYSSESLSSVQWASVEIKKEMLAFHHLVPYQRCLRLPVVLEVDGKLEMMKIWGP